MNEQNVSAPGGAISSAPPTGNPKLQSVSYTTILPEGKTSGYKPGQQVDFKIDPVQFPYIDGKQSYVLLNVTPNVSFTNKINSSRKNSNGVVHRKDFVQENKRLSG